MELRFTCLDITNFKSFREEATIRFEMLPTGLCFLRGENEVDPALESNGSGKSSIWDALTWVLYGKTLDGLRNPDIQPWGSKGKTQVKLTLELDDVEHTIWRSANPNSLRIDGKDAGADAVELLVGINYSTFAHTILLGQGQDLFFDLGPTDKLGLFSDALDLQRWDTRAASAAKKCSDLEQVRSETDRDLHGVTARLDQIEEQLKDAKAKSEVWRVETDAALERIAANLKEELKSEDSAKKKKAGAEITEDGALTEKDAIEKSWKVEYDKLFELRDVLQNTTNLIRSKRDKIKDLKTELKDLKGSDTCPTCGQSIKTKKQLNEHLEKVRAKIAKLEDAIGDIDLDGVTRNYDDQEEVVERMRPQMEEKADIAKRARSEINMWEGKLRSIGLNIAVLIGDQKKLEEATNPYGDQIAKLRKDKSKLTAKEKDLEASIEKLNGRIERMKFWVRGFKDVRLFILQEVLAELQMATNAMLDCVGLEDWRIEYDIETETKSGTTKRGLAVMVYSPSNDKPVRWESWSGGESQRLRLVGAMALSEVLLSYAGVNPNLEILDEPNRGLSPQGIHDLCVFLRDRSKALGRQIWYTDQQSTESALFSAIVTVKKTTDLGSRILVA